MSTTVDVNIKVTGAKKAAGEVADVGKSAEQGSEAIGGMTGSLDRMTGGMISGFKGVAKGIKAGVMGLKSFKMALIATGLGALLVLVGSLVAYFTKTQKGAEELEKASAALGAGFDILMDKVSALGGFLVKMFNDPLEAIQGFGASIKSFVMDKIEQLIDGFGVLGSAIGALFRGEFSEAASLAAEGFGKVGDSFLALNPITAVLYQTVTALVDMAPEVEAAAAAAHKLSQQAIALRKNQRALNIEFAEGRKEIKRLNLIAEDLNTPLEERIAAAQEAIDIEQELMDKRVAQATKERNLAAARNDISNSLEADLEDLNAAEVALINIKTESFAMQKNLQKRLQTMRDQDEALKKQKAADDKTLEDEKIEREKEFVEMKQTDRENEITALEEQYARMLVLAEEFGMSKAEVEKREKDARDALQDKWDAEDLVKTKANTDEQLEIRAAKIDAVQTMAEDSLNFLSALNDAAAQGTERQQKKAFERNKKIQIAQSIIAASRGIVNILSASSVIPDPFGAIFKGVQVALLAGTTAAQIAKIKKTQFTGGGSVSAGGASAGGGAASIPQMTQGLVPTSFGDSATAPTSGSSTEIAPVQAFVVSSSITNQQQLDATISHQSSL